MCVRSFPFFLFWAALMLASWLGGLFPGTHFHVQNLYKEKKMEGGGVTVKYVDDYEKVPDQQKEVINNYFKRTT